ncbi:MAG: hypothetical protein AAF721_27185 [Myxococcota bacterium]
MGWNLWRWDLALVTLLCVGCGGPSIIGDTVGSTVGSTGTSGSTGSGDGSSGPGLTTLAPDSTGGTTMSVTTVAPESTSSGPPIDSSSSSGRGTTVAAGTDSGTTAGDSEGSSDDTNPGGLPDGSQCTADKDCLSNECYVAGALGGICGECNEDADCVGGGCSFPNPLTSAPAQCNMGELGEGCESTAVCADDLLCNVVLDVPGILESMTCGECIDNLDCAVGTSCQPDYDIADLSGAWLCVDDMSLPDGAGCDMNDGNGDVACASGACATANFMNLLELGVCSECLDDGDCPGVQICQPPEIDLAMGLVPGFCQ